MPRHMLWMTRRWFETANISLPRSNCSWFILLGSWHNSLFSNLKRYRYYRLRNYLMYKKLVGWVCPKNGSPHLNVQMESLASAVLQQSLLGLILFNTLNSDTESASSASSQMPPYWAMQENGMTSRGILAGWRRWFAPSAPLF